MKLMENRSKTGVALLKSLGILFLALLVVGVLISLLIYPFEGPLPYALGLLLGTLGSAAKVILMEKSIDRTLDMEGAHAKNYAGLQVILRYGLTIAVLLSAVLFRGVIGLFGVVLGTLSLQFAAYLANHMLKNVDV